MLSALFALLLTLAFDGGNAPAPEDEYTLRVIRSFGTPPAGEAADTFAFGGGALDQIATIRRLSNGRIAVLDAGFKKVVVFDSLGSVERIIGRGSGRGPGEFVYPIAMAVSHDSIAVFDYSQNRVTVFDIDGRLLTTVNTQRAKDIAWLDGQLWGAKMPGRTHMLWQTSIADGINADRDILALDARHADFEPRGVFARLGEDLDGTMLVAHQRPGLWFELGADGRFGQVQGTDMLAGEKYFTSRGVPVAPGQADGIAGISATRVVIFFSRFHDQGGGGAPRIDPRRLAVLDRESGRLLGMLTFQGLDTPVTAISPGSRPNQILFSAYEPYPRVVLAEIVETRRR